MEDNSLKLSQDDLDKVSGGQRSAYHYFWYHVEPLVLKYGIPHREWRRLEKLCTPEEWAVVCDALAYVIRMELNPDSL